MFGIAVRSTWAVVCRRCHPATQVGRTAVANGRFSVGGRWVAAVSVGH